jgi:Secretion system C-terminal sorting domain
MRRLIMVVLLGITTQILQAQLYVGSGVDLVIKSGGTFHYDGLTLTPSGDFTLTNTTLTKTDANTISPPPTGTYIKRYYSFSNTTPQYAGTIRFSYLGADLNGLTASGLSLNIRTSAAWTAVGGTVESASSYLEATSLNVTNGLNTLTLASSSAALPVTWLRFVAEKKESASILNWATATEQNTKDYLVQHSISGGGWKSLGTVKAAGNSSTRSDYTFIHHTPVSGYNYYRLIQRDQDGQFSYSKVVTVLMNKEDIRLKVFPNPILDGKVNVLLKEPAQVRLFDAAGRQVLSQWLAAGLQAIDVSRYSSGTYFIKVNNESTTITIKQ